MKKALTLSVFVLALGLTGAAFAQGFQGQSSPTSMPMGGFKGPGLAPSTVEQALNLSDDTAVVLEGNIERSLGDEKYLFKDATGSVTVEIDNKDWRGITVTPEDVVVIQGEVDKDFFKTEIDVDTISLKNK